MRALLVVPVLLFGCGPQWDGRYTGTLGRIVTCTDGSAANGSDLADWTLTEKSSGLEVITTANCGTFMADVSGDVATPRQKACSPFSANGYTYTYGLRGGALTLKESALDVRLTIGGTFSGPQSGTCTMTYSGMLGRQ